jgi:hypothetical protein
MNQYLLIAEFCNKRLGFIIGTFDSQSEARFIMDTVYNDFDIYSLNSKQKIPAVYYETYQSYKIQGDEYFGSCEKFSLRYISGNGDLSVFIVRCKDRFDVKTIIAYRNLIKCYGIHMN